MWIYKLLLPIIATSSLLVLSGFVHAQPVQPENTLPENYTVKDPATDMPPVNIDDVLIPYDVLVYAQVAYQGYAVTQAEEITWNGAKAYQLRIDNDSNPHDANGMYLLYDEQWELIDTKPYYAPIPKPAPAIDTAAEPNPEPEPVEPPNPEPIPEPEPVEPPNPEPIPEPEPEPEPVEPPNPEPIPEPEPGTTSDDITEEPALSP